MDPEWTPNDYAWDAETLVATRHEPSSPSCEDGSMHTNAKGKKKRGVKILPKVFCQIDGCGARLDAAYYRKYRVCQGHAKAPAVVISGQAVRFCQKCARFHDLVEFDMDRRSCRVRLAEHNRRRRAMTDRYKPTDSESDHSMDRSIPDANNGGSSYNTPSNSTPSYRTATTTAAVADIERAYSLSSLPADIAATVATLPLAFTIDDLIGPLATCLHQLNQVMPETVAAAIGGMQQQQQQQQQVHIQQAAPPVDIILPKPNGSAFSFPQNHANASAAAASADHAIPGLTEDVAAAFDATDIFNDMDLDLALAGILDPVVDPSLPPPPVYTSPDVVVRMSMKLFSCMPSDLPPTLRVELERSMDINFSMIEGYVRPGCTHLTVDLRLPSDVAARIHSTPLEIIMEELAKKLPSDHGLLAQLGHHVAAIKSGKTLGVVDASGPRGPHLAALSRVCVSVDEAASTRVDLYGANIGRPGDLVLCRQHGEHVTVEMLDSPAWNMVAEEHDEQQEQDAAAAEEEEENEDNEDVGSDDDDSSATGVLDVDYASSSVKSGTSSTCGWDPTNGRNKAGCMPATSVRLFGLCCGVAEVEVQAGGAMSAARPLLVLPDAAAAAEVEGLACRARRAPWLDAFLRDAGLVVAHICSEGAAARLPGDVVEAIAARTSAYCMEAGCPALGRLLRRAQNALRRAIGTDDTASKMAEMLEGAAKEKVERSLANENEISTSLDVGEPGVDGSIIPLVENFKGLTVGGDDGNIKTKTSTTTTRQGGQQGWKGLMPMIALGCVAVAVAVTQLFQS